ncbi:MAG TPA: hypothetical protein VF120_07370 [Ktedonobacterales bacterium]
MPQVPRVPDGSAPRTGEGLPSQERAPAEAGEQIWVSPGVSMRKRVLTGLLILAAAGVFLLIAAHEGASMWVSTLIGAVFIGCFIWYLRIVAPMPFTLHLGATGISREEPGGSSVVITWPEVARVKEEVFKNGKPISLSVYKRVGERGVYRAFVIYRDDIARFDGLLSALREALPEGTRWQRETVHE